MTPTETKTMYAATCRICTLASAMRDCDACLFRQPKVTSKVRTARLIDELYGQLQPDSFYAEMEAQDADWKDLKETEADILASMR